MHDDGRTTLAAARRWARLRAAYLAAVRLYRKEATDDHAARMDRARFALDATLSYSHAAQLGQGGEA